MTKRSKWFREGSAAGSAAASWVFDGNTSDDTYRRVLEMLNEGDPQVYDQLAPPSPLSGEWSGESIPEIFGMANPPARWLELFEEGFDQSYWDTIETVAADHVASQDAS